MQSQSELPDKYAKMTGDEVDAAIRSAKDELGSDAVILGHHYQQDQVLKFVDHTGDSLQLARLAAEQSQARYVIFCGVLFMAETADILTDEEQAVILPHLEAGCPMADMAELEDVERCWEMLRRELNDDVVPVAYVNSSADIKAFCGARGGTVCTSSSADEVMSWALEQANTVLFLPDRHLGRNTGHKLGISRTEMALWNREKQELSPPGGAPRLILWDGHCPVHVKFDEDAVARMRQRYPEGKIIVHPECPSEVVEMAAEQGSTEHIRKTIGAAGAGSQWLVGTELKLVSRLARQHPDQTIACLDDDGVCEDMDFVTPAHLLWVLEELVAGRIVNRVRVKREVIRDARAALDRMFSLL